MNVILVLLAAAVALTSAHPHTFSAEERTCIDLLRPTQDPNAAEASMTKCIEAQSGLQAIIDSLKKEHRGPGGPGGPQGPGGPGGPRGPGGPGGLKGPGGPGGPPHGGVFDLLEKNGHKDQALLLKICMAGTRGHLTPDGKFNVAAFQSELKAKAAGEAQEANVQLGVDNCPTTLLNDFDEHGYMHCITAYCATGQAPAPQ